MFVRKSLRKEEEKEMAHFSRAWCYPLNSNRFFGTIPLCSKVYNASKVPKVVFGCDEIERESICDN